ncbi:hypothetical protein DVW87_02330 [Sphingomonas aracearum]|uniref:Uncharacterized protein n=1 Tax=Sphingomonas aracearum TaxID=2283317 RepID=A0A369W0M4_9SPHN|nr:hypothetical protein DVW87_02330 [Sphingomonas aracearum]
MVLAAPLIVDATVRSAQVLKGADAAGVQPGTARFYVEADVTALVRGASGVPPRVAYVVDLPLDARGRPPRLKKRRVLLFARATANPAQVQLVGTGAQRDWTPGLDALARGIATETVAAGAPPEVTGIGNAFHVPGALPGEGETQIFLKTRDGRPISLSVLRRSGEQPRWAAAFSEVVDESATPPARDTLAWYRLACALPRELPDASLATAEPGDAAQAREDYRFVLQQLGDCTTEG